MAKKSVKQLIEAEAAAFSVRRRQSILIGFALLIAALLVYTQAS